MPGGSESVRLMMMTAGLHMPNMPQLEHVSFSYCTLPYIGLGDLLPIIVDWLLQLSRFLEWMHLQGSQSHYDRYDKLLSCGSEVLVLLKSCSWKTSRLCSVQTLATLRSEFCRL